MLAGCKIQEHRTLAGCKIQEEHRMLAGYMRSNIISCQVKQER